MSAPSTTAREAARSLHDVVRGDIEAQVMSGAWPPGHRIPYEHELMRQYGCSRMTINRALASLVERGLIERRRRAGSFVSTPAHHRAAFDLPDLRAQVTGRGHRHGFDLLERTIRAAGAGDRALLNMAGGEVLRLLGRHCADATPFALEDRLINLALVPQARGATFDREPPDSWLFAHVPWSDARHRFAAAAADAATAHALGIAEGSPCMTVERWTWRTSATITYARTIHPAHLFSLEARFRP